MLLAGAWGFGVPPGSALSQSVSAGSTAQVCPRKPVRVQWLPGLDLEGAERVQLGTGEYAGVQGIQGDGPSALPVAGFDDLRPGDAVGTADHRRRPNPLIDTRMGSSGS